MSKRKPSRERRPTLFPGKVRDRNSSYAFTQTTHDKIDAVQERLSARHGRDVSRTDAIEFMIDAFPLSTLRKTA